MTLHNLQTPVSYERALRAGASQLRQSGTPLLDARVLLKKAAGLDDAELIQAAGNNLADDVLRRYGDLISRRKKGEPVAYITGGKEFWGLNFSVSPGALIPRPDSETIIEAIVTRRSKTADYSILDLGAGSGCLLCSLLHELPKSAGLGVDISETAIAHAKANAKALGLTNRAHYWVGDWASAARGHFDIIVANPPYIRESERNDLSIEIREYEPVNALFAGKDGLGAYRAIFPALPALSAPRGLIALEVGARQGAVVREMAIEWFPGATVKIIKDIAGQERVVLIEKLSDEKKD